MIPLFESFLPFYAKRIDTKILEFLGTERNATDMHWTICVEITMPAIVCCFLNKAVAPDNKKIFMDFNL